MVPPITVDNIDSVNKVYDEALEEGLSKEEAQIKALLSEEELEEHLENLSQEYFPVRKIISFYNLVTFPTIEKYGGWDNMSIQQKKDFLWEVGMDSRNYGWKTRIGLHRELGGKVILDKYVESNERTDKKWLTMVVNGVSVASFEAKIYAAKDKSLEYELRKISNTQSRIFD